MRLFLAVLVCGPLLAACATLDTEQEAAGGTIGKLVQASRADLEEARRSAEAHDDRLALMCWDGLLKRLDEGDGVYVTEVVGPASAYQKVRNIRRIVLDGGLSDEIKIACGPMLIDSASVVRRAVIGGVL